MMEIMAPVGSFESLAAAIQAGANSIYFGVGKLNMRSRSASNFDLDDMGRIVSTAHAAGVRCYLTVNTVVYNHELEEMRKLLLAAREVGVDAVIASDMAVIESASQLGIEIHISTQCNISNSEAVRYYSRYADVMVTARELPLAQVAEITNFIKANDIRGPHGELVRIELFAHGALCMSVSGKCYLSLDAYNHSANRGACLQLCRRGYLVTDMETGLELEVDNQYIMSPKDLCTIGFLDKMAKAGVQVLKIEGRGRSADYVKTVVTCYREAVEAIEAGTYTREAIADWTERLRTVFNRGFWDGYYLGRTMGEWSDRYGSQATENKVYLGKVTNYFNRPQVAEMRIETRETLRKGDRYMVTGETTGVYTGIVDGLRVDNGEGDALQVSQGDLFTLKTAQPLHRGDKLYRIDTVLDEF
ncbi:MAG: U32 family peptidase [Bacteroidales bacterium]|nr:U32 family peptidase [Bacteroidales bacterium]